MQNYMRGGRHGCTQHGNVARAYAIRPYRGGVHLIADCDFTSAGNGLFFPQGDTLRVVGIYSRY